MIAFFVIKKNPDHSVTGTLLFHKHCKDRVSFLEKQTLQTALKHILLP